ncbi:MAG: hypothetical protein HND48_14850 [Chloroflexi bacterium]|nr:hypothetical protein [Chloroflexota bacterium]
MPVSDARLCAGGQDDVHRAIDQHQHRDEDENPRDRLRKAVEHSVARHDDARRDEQGGGDQQQAHRAADDTGELFRRLGVRASRQPFEGGQYGEGHKAAREVDQNDDDDDGQHPKHDLADLRGQTGQAGQLFKHRDSFCGACAAVSRRWRVGAMSRGLRIAHRDESGR